MTKALQEEVDARVSAMEATGDIPEDEREHVALEDIANLSADEHGAYTPAEVRAWNRLRAEARRLLASC